MKPVSVFLLLTFNVIAKPVCIDTDPSVQQEGVHEVDDGFALVQAFRSKELGIRGVIVVFGNAPLAGAFPMGRRSSGGTAVRAYISSKEPQGGEDIGSETEASRGCPPPRREAYMESRLDAQLDDNTRTWLADSSRNQFFPERRVAEVNPTSKWYRADFEKNGGSVKTFLAKYAPWLPPS